MFYETKVQLSVFLRDSFNSPFDPKAKFPEFLEARSANDKPAVLPKPNDMTLFSIKEEEKVKGFSLPFLKKVCLLLCSHKNKLESLQYFYLPINLKFA